MKKLAHEVILEMILEKVDYLSTKQLNPLRFEGATSQLSICLEILSKMALSTKHLDEVVHQLRLIKLCAIGKHVSYVTKLLDNAIAELIRPIDNKLVDFINSGKELASDEGKRLLEEIDEATIKSAYNDPAAAAAISAILNKIGDPYIKRKLLKALGA